MTSQKELEEAFDRLHEILEEIAGDCFSANKDDRCENCFSCQVIQALDNLADLIL